MKTLIFTLTLTAVLLINPDGSAVTTSALVSDSSGGLATMASSSPNTEDSHKVQKTEPSITAVVTAYSSVESCHYPNCVMANGEPAHIGAVACPREIPLGTKVRIGAEIYTCKDRTAKWVDGRYDIFMGYGQEAYRQAVGFGKRSLEVQVIK